MNPSTFCKFRYGAASVAIALALASHAHAISITAGNVAGGVDNVLFNATTDASGTMVNGTFNSQPTFFVNFSSTNQLEVQGGQATLTGLGGGTFQNLTFELANNATFTKAILNPDATTAGNINFSVTYLTPASLLFNTTFSLNANGQNFFTILAGDGELIRSVTFSSTDSAFADSGQFRIGGLANATTSNVPDGGVTVAFLGLALGLLGTARRIFA
jgi:hypothetical protein